MEQFGLYLKLGFEHITDFAGYDHMLFLAAICAGLEIKDWRKVFWLVTAFTLGHTITLALSTFRLVDFNSGFIEFLIPCTIFATCVLNYFRSSNISTNNTYQRNTNRLQYALVAFFGLIHGLGFSNYLKSLLGKTQNILIQLFAFNLGVEVGQLCVVLALLVVGSIFVVALKVSKREWSIIISAAVAAWSISLILKTFPSALI